MYFVYVLYCVVFFFKQKTAYEMRISDWSSDVCSSDLSSAYFGANYMQQTTESQNWVDEDGAALERLLRQRHSVRGFLARPIPAPLLTRVFELAQLAPSNVNAQPWRVDVLSGGAAERMRNALLRSEEHTSELQSLMRISYAVF